MTDVPPWQDTATLAGNLSISESTVERYAEQGIIPPPRKRGGKNFWKWAEVDEWMTNGPPGASTDSLAERIRHGANTLAGERRHLRRIG